MVISICSLMEPNWKIHLRSHCRYFKSYQDDINSVWSGGAEALNCLFWQLNYKHPRIKFTLEREKMLSCHFWIYRLNVYLTDLSQRCILKTRILKSMLIGVAMYPLEFIHIFYPYKTGYYEKKLGVMKEFIHITHLFCDI